MRSPKHPGGVDFSVSISTRCLKAKSILAPSDTWHLTKNAKVVKGFTMGVDTELLDGDFKYFLFSSLPGEDSHFD